MGTLTGTEAGETLYSDNFFDNVNGLGGDDTLNGRNPTGSPSDGEGKDYFSGGNGNDTLNGFGGADWLKGDDGTDELNGGEGDDHLEGGNDDDTLNGDQGDDILYGDAGDDILRGHQGQDKLFGGAGNDQLFGGSENDQLRGGDGNDLLEGESGNDLFYTGDGVDIVNGGEGDDKIYLERGTNTANAGEGDDEIRIGYGNNTVDGGAGNDTAIFQAKQINYEILETANNSYTVTALPGGVDYNGDGVFGTTTLTNVENILFNGSNWDGVLADDCDHDTLSYKLTGLWKTREDTDICEFTGSFSIVGKYTNNGLYVETTGQSTHDGKNLTVADGTIFGFYNGVKTQLFSGQITIPLQKATFNVTDLKNDANDLQYGGVDFKYNKLNFDKSGLEAHFSVILPENLTGAGNVVALEHDGLQLTIKSNDGPRVTISQLEFADTQFSFFNFFNVDATKQKISYNSLTDTLTLSGKYEIDNIIRGAGLDKISLLADSIEINKGTAELKGSLKLYDNTEIENNGWGFNNIEFTIDTKANKIGGTIGVKFPFKGTNFEVEGSLDLVTSPSLTINGFGLKLDGLSIPVGASGVFLKSVNGKVAHLAPTDTAPVAFTGGLELTAGPTIGSKSLATFALDATLDENSITGTGKLTIIDDKVMNATGKAVIDWHKNITSFDGTFSIVDGFITTNNNFKANARFDFSFAGKASLNIPKFIGGFGGKNIADANYQVSFTNDGNMSNDYATGWAEHQFSGFGLKMKYALGAKYTFDGEWSLFGLNEIPQIQAVAKEIGATEPVKLDWIFLMANWENSIADDVALQVIDPNGNIIKQVDFASHKIEIIDNLSSKNGVTLIVVDPLAGDWKLAITNADQLGEVNYSAGTENAKPVLTFDPQMTRILTYTDPKILFKFNIANVNETNETITTSFFYDTDQEGADGTLIQLTYGETSTTETSGGSTWQIRDVADGTYYIYAVTSDGINPDVITYSDSRIFIGDVEKETANDDSIINTLGGTKLTGDVGHDKIFTLAGINQIDGGYDSDFIMGGFESDTLNGGRGNDLIIGDASDLIGGSDRINGGKGNDLLMGGIGADIFSFTSDDGKDVIAQFKADAVEFDLVAGFSATPSGADFQVGVDHIELNGFFNVDSENVLNSISQGEDGAVFSAEGTQITFFGIEATQLSANDFLFV